MKSLIDKLQGLWPEHCVALSVPKEVDQTKEELYGILSEGIIYYFLDKSIEIILECISNKVTQFFQYV